ncbi:hypothetical protein D1B33_14300 [Lysinibacillus yapensis]|uniref:General stress protein 17M-like domain-containing protein n=1 Tax=Ureibacillus yapensis TaxID=2304605 RepID=A0A396SAT1_9BACL|nr:general stress protein [Lysinibacillus yapensis]RHW33975.1 hypothetical protein D1B33_14300 [Lysinibacillus yapensis]
MYSSHHNSIGRYNIEVAHTKTEALGIIDRLKNDGIPKGQINVIGKDLDGLKDLKWDPDVDVQKTGTVGDKFKSLFTGEDAVMEGLKDADLPESQLLHYKEVVENGGVLIYTDDYIETTVVERDLPRDLNSFGNYQNPLL